MFTSHSSGQECFHYQLIVENKEGLVLPTTQQLLELSFLQSDIKLAKVKTFYCLSLILKRLVFIFIRSLHA
jgi:hypothetical protein